MSDTFSLPQSSRISRIDDHQMLAAIAATVQGVPEEDKSGFQKFGDYIKDAALTTFVGQYAEVQPNALGIAGSVAFGATGLDAPKNIADLVHDVHHWETSWWHAGGMALNAVALLPIAGAFVQLGKNAKHLKSADAAVDAAKQAGKAADVAKPSTNIAKGLPEDANVVRGGLNTPEQVAKGIKDHPQGVTGVSVHSAPGKSIDELAQGIPNGKIGTTTVGEVRSAGGDVIPTTGRSPDHATLTGLDAGKISELLQPPIPNPAKRR